MVSISEQFSQAGRDDTQRVRRALVFGLAISLGLHWVAVDQAAAYWDSIREEVAARPSRTEATVELEFAPPEDRFAEANPDAPENTPEPTPLIAARDQQAAQPEPDRKATEVLIPDAGGDLENPKVVEASPFQRPEMPSGVYADTDRVPEQVGDPSIESSQGDLEIEEMDIQPGGVSRQSPEFLEEPEMGDPESAPVRIAEGEPQAPEDAAETERSLIDLGPESAEEEPVAETQTESETRTPGRPLPRPRLSPDVLRGPVMRSESSAYRAGAIALESKFTEFGAYQQRMYEAISAEWNRLAYEVGVPVADRPSRILVRFDVDPFGEVSDVEVVETSAGVLATQLCTDAVRARAPYGEWTESMRASLGRLTEVRIGFRYF